MARRYHSWWNRFDQPDPYDGSYDLGNPQSFNRYSYVNNDPVNFIDPTGLLCWATFLVTTTYIGGKKIKEVWTFLGIHCDTRFTAPTNPQSYGGLFRGRGNLYHFVVKPATPEQVRKQNLSNCLAKANANFKKAANAQAAHASNPFSVGVVGGSAGYATNRAFGSGRVGSGASVIAGSQFQKMLESYWALLGPSGFGAEYTKDVDACHSLWGH